MNDVGPLPDEIAALLATERAIASVPAERRHRSLRRAESALAQATTAHHVQRSLWKFGRLLAAAAVVFSAFAVAATRARNHAAGRATETSAAPTASAAPVSVEPAPELAPSTSVPSAASVEQDAPAPPVASSAAPALRTRTRAEERKLELTLLEPARAALDRADFPAAFRAIHDHQQAFPRGQLSEEREALRVLALLGEKRVSDARAAANAFSARFPHSVLTPRLQEAAAGAQ